MSKATFRLVPLPVMKPSVARFVAISTGRPMPACWIWNRQFRLRTSSNYAYQTSLFWAGSGLEGRGGSIWKVNVPHTGDRSIPGYDMPQFLELTPLHRLRVTCSVGCVVAISGFSLGLTILRSEIRVWHNYLHWCRLLHLKRTYWFPEWYNICTAQ